MKKLLTILFTLFALTSIACHEVSLTETNAIDNGDGTYTYKFELCMGIEDTWGFYLDFNGANLVSWTNSVTSPSTGETINASVPPISGNGKIEYGDWDDDTSPVFSGNTNDCITFSITLDSQISSITVDGLQPNYNPPGPGKGCSATTSTTDTLPVELLSFETNRDGTEIKIFWITATERRSDYFELVKRTKDSHWTVVDTIDATGNTVQEQYYETYDESKHTTYYKLLQYDRDGEREVYGPIVSESKENLSKPDKIINLRGQEVNKNYKGLKFYIYN